VTALVLAGPDAASHDFVVGASGDYAAAIAAIAAAPGAVVETPITRSNYRVLGDLPALLAARGVSAWRLTVAAMAATEPAAQARTIPRLALALPHALHAAARARALGLDVTIVDAPRCLLGPFAELAATTAPRAFAAACQACRARERCGGVDPDYLARFGAGELTPQP
jgi:hypothetical protein